jgi:predicted dithiol-disulfide oxidoreductase (DUF899 family)
MNKVQISPDIEDHKVVSSDDWIAARKELLKKEKEFTRLRDELSRQSRELPWVRVEKEYVFDGPEGRKTLADLFEGRSQLIVKHFMFGPGWAEGCLGCSFGADHDDGIVVHLEHHDVTYVAVSRAPLSEIEAFKKRMGWSFKWVSSSENDFNFDYHVSFNNDESATGQVYYNYELGDFVSDELPGISLFYKDPAGAIYHTYSAYSRGVELLGGAYGYLDHLPKGRNETKNGNLSDWVRHHDKYDDAQATKCH